MRIPVDAHDPVRLMLFPEMEPERDVPEITTACWGILHKSPDDVMCAGVADGGEAQGRSGAGGAGLHAAGLRSALRDGDHLGGGVPTGVAQPPVLRLVLRAGRRVLQPLSELALKRSAPSGLRWQNCRRKSGPASAA